MRELIEEWKRLAEKYYQQAIKDDNNPMRQEGAFCRSEVYNYCASKLEEFLCGAKKQKN